MLKIDFLCVGNIKDKFFLEAQNEYLKRLSKFADVTVKELKEFNELNNIETIKEKEGELILGSVKGYFVLLDVDGVKNSSVEFSKTIEKIQNTNSQISFVIGGSYGVSDEVKKRANLKISFSEMTFPHRLFRIMLLEQVYRAFCIAGNIPYHK